MIRTVLFSLVAIGLVSSTLAVNGQEKKGGNYNTKIKIGEAAPTFSNLPGVDGKMLSMADLSSKDVLVVCITCNHCPVAVAYEDRLIQFAKKYTSGPDSKVALVAINVNTSESDRLDKMVLRAKEKGFNFPYLYDETQKIARDYGAKVTPEFFVLNKERKVAYTGAMDDSMRVENVTKTYVADAVDALLKGQTVTVSLAARQGCGIQYNSQK